MGIMPNDRNERLESVARRFGIPGTPRQSDCKRDESNPVNNPNLPPSSPAPDPRHHIPIRNKKRG